MRLRFVIIFCTIVAILWLMQLYLYFGFSEWLAAFPLSAGQVLWTKRIVLAVLIYFNASIPARILLRGLARRNFRWLKYLVIFPGTTWLISMIMMFLLFVAKDIALWLADFLDIGNHRQLLQAAGTFSIGAPLLLTGYGALKTARNYKIETVELPFENLPSALDGFTIAQISDIHSGMFMTESEMRKVLEIINSLHPHMAALTGDYVDTLAAEIAPVVRVFSQIKSDFGTFACMGNHDLFDDYAEISRAMKESGIVMLENSGHVLKIDGEELNVLGVADGRLARLDKAMEGMNQNAFKVLLAHRPRFFHRAAESGIDLQLSGHTHGGQIALNPVNLVYLFERYAHGLYEQAKSKLYVNPGVGMVFAPIRIGVPPEITLIKLRKNHQDARNTKLHE